MPACLSRILFGAFLIYSPRGKSEVSVKSQDLVRNIKVDRAGIIAQIVRRLAEEIAAARESVVLRACLGADVMLVPCPRSTPITAGALWPAERICSALVANGLGRSTEPWLERVQAVQKSAFASPNERPRVEDHIATMKLSDSSQTLNAPRQITLIDDVITKGATLLAGASHLQEQFPSAQVTVFALVRTMGLVPEIDAILRPCVGEIRFEASGPQREP